jgi:hypothetical protein
MGSTTGYWGQEARKAIDAAMADAKRDGLSWADTVKRIDAAYPFGERKYWAYKAWLKERRKALGIVSRKRQAAQAPLFEVSNV